MRRFEDGVKCYMEVGFTEPCAAMWVYNGFQTKDRCAPVCGAFTILGNPNNGPPPQCELATCLECDEVAAGPEFAGYAARTRRRSGLLSMIARPCSALLDVTHVDPCAVARAMNGTGASGGENSAQDEELDPGFENPDDQRLVEKVLKGECWNYTEALGLFYYSGVKEGGGLIARLNPFSNIMASSRDKYFQSVYDTCYKYRFSSVSDGLWKDIKETFGPAFTAASAFAVFAVILGFLGVVVTWMSSCAAFLPRTWIAMAIFHAFASAFMFLSLLFFTSDVCEHGCQIGSGGICAVLSGCFFLAAAVLCGFIAPYDKRMRAIQCCCCPTTDDEFSGGVTEVVVRKTVEVDGTVTTERLTTHPSGFKSKERTICVPEQRQQQNDAHAVEKTEEALEKVPLLALSEVKETAENGVVAPPVNS